MPDRNKPKIIVTRKLPDLIETRMMELFEPQLNLDDIPFDREALIAAVQNADVLVPTLTDRIDKSIIEAAGPRLKLIASFGTGVDHIDLQAASEKQIVVTNTPGVLTEDTADMAVALMLAVSRRLVESDALVRSGEWSGWSPTSMLGMRMNGKRLGIIGMGRIGSAVARRAAGFNLAVHYHNRRPVAPELENEVDATYWSSLDQMLARMDIISINCPHTPATFHLLSRRRLALMQPHAIIVNTSRGEVIDEDALAERLERRELGGAGLDVYEHEPAVSKRLLNLTNVVLLPHTGSATHDGRIAMGERVLLNIRSFADGHAPPDRVLATEF
ncbi:MAG: D-glycerate dehydrogenase [Pseudomonadota bacterium]